MRRTGLALMACALFVACGPADEAEEMDAAEEMDTAGAMMEEGLTAADLAGTWSMVAVSETGDTVTTMEMMVAEDPSAWTLTFPDRDPLPMDVVAMEGDSVVTEVGPYESVLREGTMVTTRMVSRLEDGRLVGTWTATYDTTEPDSVVSGRSEGTRAP